MNNTCVCCGAPVPEGRMVCPLCEMETEGESGWIVHTHTARSET